MPDSVTPKGHPAHGVLSRLIPAIRLEVEHIGAVLHRKVLRPRSPTRLSDRLRELGVSQRGVQLERDGWILMQSVSPKEAAIWIADKRDAIGDPEFRAIYLEYDAAFDWSPDDPRLDDRAHRWLANRAGHGRLVGRTSTPGAGSHVAAAQRHVAGQDGGDGPRQHNGEAGPRAVVAAEPGIARDGQVHDDHACLIR